LVAAGVSGVRQACNIHHRVNTATAKSMAEHSTVTVEVMKLNPPSTNRSKSGSTIDY
jgi:hypothetical protein